MKLKRLQFTWLITLKLVHLSVQFIPHRKNYKCFNEVFSKCYQETFDKPFTPFSIPPAVYLYLNNTLGVLYRYVRLVISLCRKQNTAVSDYSYTVQPDPTQFVSHSNTTPDNNLWSNPIVPTVEKKPSWLNMYISGFTVRQWIPFTSLFGFFIHSVL